MARVTPVDIRSSVTDTGPGLEIVIPARRRVFALLFLPVWLFFWTIGGLFAFATLLSPETPGGVDLFMGVWLCGWALGEVSVVTTILWMLRGREVVRVDRDVLIIRREVFGVGPTQEYDTREVANLRASPLPFGVGAYGSSPLALLRQGAGTIAFDYGAKTYRFGIAMEEAEARILIRQMEEKVPLTRTGAD
jgi:hypothetical protein